jgi:hypothetical protein
MEKHALHGLLPALIASNKTSAHAGWALAQYVFGLIALVVGATPKRSLSVLAWR